MKTCKSCSCELPNGAFYNQPKAADGLMAICRGCHRERVARNYKKNREHYRAYERSRLHDPKRIAIRKRTAERWRNDPVLHARHNEMRKLWLRRKRAALKAEKNHAKVS